MQKKMKVLYGYDMQGINVSDEEIVNILEEQRRYELGEFKRLKTARTEQKYNGHIDFEKSKKRKIETLNRRIKSALIEIAKNSRLK